MSRPPLHALQGFVAAARAGNLSRAAESMHLTVSALSHQIRALEERVGHPLFVRAARGVALTDDGRALFERVAPHLDEIEEALRPFRVRRDDMLTLTVMPSFASSWLLPRLPRFLAAQPQLQITLQSTISLVDFERDARVDAGLRYGRGQWPGLVAVHLFDDWVIPTASPALIARLGRPAERRHSLQIELHRGLYMDEHTRERSPGFGVLQAALTGVAADIAAYVKSQI